MSLSERITRRVLRTAAWKKLQEWAAGPTLKLAIRFPNPTLLALMCHANRFATSGSQVGAIARSIQQRGPCKLLIFGLGNDSAFYHAINAGGRTVFLEDNEKWLTNVTSRHPQLEAYKVSYKTKVSEWRKYLENPEPYATTLPPEVTSVKWDIIFVDAPEGYDENTPGRMESLRLAIGLVDRPGEIFVHDCEREVEQVFTAHYLKPENLKSEVANLRQYVFSVT